MPRAVKKPKLKQKPIPKRSYNKQSSYASADGECPHCHKQQTQLRRHLNFCKMAPNKDKEAVKTWMNLHKKYVTCQNCNSRV